MCGIAGWIGPPDSEALAAMVTSLRHRGPDESGYWADDLASLGIARLAIIDVAGGQQPVFSADQSVSAVFNGEIYNFRELQAELISAGFRLRRGSDAEVIPHLYQLYGLGFVERLQGMFAIALWDSKSQRLILVRDRAGKKPLYYASQGSRTYFASEAKALLSAGWRSTPDLEALNSVLAFGYLPLDRGAWHGLKAVPPAHYAVVTATSSYTRRYWQWNLRGGPCATRSRTELLGQLDDVLRLAVRRRLVAERPLGVFLSGGFDSSIVTALMVEEMKDRVKTFSIGVNDSRYDESSYARGVAEYLKTDHTELFVEPNPERLVQRVSDVFDQPLADSSAIPTLLVSDLAAQQVVVALSGDGGDEAFGGYVRYWAAPLLQRMNLLLQFARPMRPLIREVVKRSPSRRLARLERNLVPLVDLETTYARMMTWVNQTDRSQLWSADVRHKVLLAQPEKAFRSQWMDLGELGSLNQMRLMDMSTYLPGDLMVKVDTTSMSCSLEVRSPFLDQTVLEFAGGLSPKDLIRGRETKALIRDYAYSLIPRRLLDRPKMGFAIPRAEWLRGPLRELAHDALLGTSSRRRGWFDHTFIEEALRDHDRGDDRDAMIWPALMIELWAQRWVDTYSERSSS